MPLFKCAESPEHVQRVNVSVQMIKDILEFCRMWDVGALPVNITEQMSLMESFDCSQRHDLLHMIIGFMTQLDENGKMHPAIEAFGEPWRALWEEVRINNERCLRGESH